MSRSGGPFSCGASAEAPVSRSRNSCFGGKSRFGGKPCLSGQASGEVSVTHEHSDGVAEIHAVVAFLEECGEVRFAVREEDAAEAGGL